MTAMRKLLPMLLLAVAMTGCASQSPTQTALDTHTAYNVALSGLIEARHAGLINDSTKARIEAVRVPLYDAILSLDQAAITDNTTGYATALRQVRTLLPAFQKFLLQFQKPPPVALK